MVELVRVTLAGTDLRCIDRKGNLAVAEAKLFSTAIIISCFQHPLLLFVLFLFSF
jgi:hypothetical protein